MVSEIERRAWDNRTSADKHRPIMALNIMLDDVERGLVNPRHIIVVYVDKVDDHDSIGYYQAGDCSQLETEAALNRAIRVTWDEANG